MNRRHSLRQFFIFLGVAVFAGLFTVVYYQFSHGLYSDCLTWLFLAPLSLALAYMILFLSKAEAGILSTVLLDCGMATMTVFLALSGIYQIAEAVNAQLPIFLVVAIILLSAGAVALAVNIIRASCRRGI